MPPTDRPARSAGEVFFLPGTDPARSAGIPPPRPTDRTDPARSAGIPPPPDRPARSFFFTGPEIPTGERAILARSDVAGVG